jgi:hypothetical protein
VPLIAVIALAATPAIAALAASAAQVPAGPTPSAPTHGCLDCHAGTDAATMHQAPSVRVSCTDCHGGDGSVRAAGPSGSDAWRDAKRRAHVRPRNTRLFASSRNPERSYTALLDEELAFVRFVNPGDLRAAPLACGRCHPQQVKSVASSMMRHGAMLYGAALYNNGILPDKDPVIGESYDARGRPQVLRTSPAPPAELARAKGILSVLFPFPRFEIGPPGNPFRAFEPGGRRRPETGLADPAATAGLPDLSLSFRGPSTLNRVEPIILGAQKTRLFDPLLSFLGTNDHPGDYRSSGCSACHVVYANDRSPVHSGPYAAAGNRGRSTSVDPTLPTDEPGHPIRHVFTSSIPTSQCMTCHMHPGTNMVASFMGYTFWDNELDGEAMYPREPRTLSASERDLVQQRNPEGAALRGLWSDPEFLAELSSLNPRLRRTQFADFHGHGWVFRAVVKRDREGRLLDAAGQAIPESDPARLAKAVHLRDIHLERGMHCVDCHFSQDVHGTGLLHGETRAAVEIDCVDCHGTVTAPASLRTSGPASRGADLSLKSTPFGLPRFVRREGKLLQRSMLEEGREWEVPQVRDGVTPGHPRYSERSAYAKTLLRDGATWGAAPAAGQALAHDNASMTCFACHSAWTTSCFGCHLTQTAAQRKPSLHNEGGASRNWTSYNFQTLRDDVFSLARDGTVTGRRIAPARSSCAILASSRNLDGYWIYSQQQTVSAAGFAGTAFSTFVPHTVRGKETKACTDCHLSPEGDNNAWMASLLLQGTGLVSFVGRSVFVGEGRAGLEAVTVTERDEPQAVLGSGLHQLAYPDRHRAHLAAGGRLARAFHHGGDVRSLQLRGEYLFAAEGRRGLRVYDVARLEHDGFAQRILAAPVSGLAQDLEVATRDATSLALPSTMTVDPTRRAPADAEEQPVHPIYDLAFVSDREEGLVVVGRLHVLLDGDPRNNRIGRLAAFNPQGALAGASSITLAGTTGYVTTPRALAVLDLADPLRPRLAASVPLRSPRAVAVQFRYAFVVDADGLGVVDVTEPGAARVVAAARVPLADARGLSLARTYAYVAAGRDGLAIVDIVRPEAPRLALAWNANGAIDDAHDVEVGMTNGSAFAYLADGRNGLRVVETVSANDTPGAYGFSPRPTPRLIASYRTRGPAIALSSALDRDRAVDETGNQVAVFGRRGARPLSLEEQRRLYLRDGRPYTVSNTPPAATGRPTGRPGPR